MKAALWYRISAVLLLLFAIGHTLGFRKADPRWGVDGLLLSMRSVHFDVQGFHRTYWDFFLAFGFSATIFFLFAAVLAWQLASLPADSPVQLRAVRWAFALAFAALTVLSWNYLFMLPVVFSALVTVCLALGAWVSGRQHARPS